MFLEFWRFERKFSISVLKKAHYHIRTNNVLPISAIYFWTFPNSEALKCMISDYRRLGKPPPLCLNFFWYFFSKGIDKYKECSLFLWNFLWLCTCSLNTGLTNNLILFVVNEQTKVVPRHFVYFTVINCRGRVSLQFLRLLHSNIT